MNTLPDVLLDIIWNNYWAFKYTEDIVCELNKPLIEINKMNRFLFNHFYFNQSYSYDKQIKVYLVEFNNMLLHFKNNIALNMLSRRIDNRLNYCYDDIDKIYKDVCDNLKILAVYCVTVGPFEQRYRILDRFTKL